MSGTQLKRTIALFLFLLVAITGAGYILGVTSPAFRVAESQVKNSSKIARDVGVVKKVALRINGYSKKIEPGIGNSTVTLSIRVYGAKGHTDIDLRITGHDDNWTIVSSSVPL